MDAQHHGTVVGFGAGPPPQAITGVGSSLALLGLFFAGRLGFDRRLSPIVPPHLPACAHRSLVFRDPGSAQSAVRHIQPFLGSSDSSFL